MTKIDSVLSYVGSVKKITKHRFCVDSHSELSKSHTVQRIPKSNIWYCDCAYFHYQLTRSHDYFCYHIEACMMHKEKELTARNVANIKVNYICPKCHSTSFTKAGLRPIKNDLKRQIYKCNQCKGRFTLLPKGFTGHRSSPETVMDAIYMYIRGMSSRNVSRQLNVTYQINVTHTTILNWVEKYIRLIKNYTDTLSPELSNIWSLDEMVMNVKGTEKMGKGFHIWLWSIIDPHTRFLIASIVSKKRETKNARKIIQKGKNISLPDYIITDSLNSYEGAIRKELLQRVAHIKTKAIKDNFTNRPIERYHNEIRENLKTRRGLGNDKSSQDFAEMLQINHNFIRPHMGLDGKTPAEIAGIDTDLGDDKLAGLINKASDTRPKFVKNLGKRIEHVHIFNDGDSVRIAPKSWIRKRTWREINDILHLKGFVWLSRESDSCWIHQNPQELFS